MNNKELAQRIKNRNALGLVVLIEKQLTDIETTTGTPVQGITSLKPYIQFCRG
ncbi:MAG: hypothetical protein ABIJ18_03360 [archaeon]